MLVHDHNTQTINNNAGAARAIAAEIAVLEARMATLFARPREIELITAGLRPDASVDDADVAFTIAARAVERASELLDGEQLDDAFLAEVRRLHGISESTSAGPAGQRPAA